MRVKLSVPQGSTVLIEYGPKSKHKIRRTVKALSADRCLLIVEEGPACVAYIRWDSTLGSWTDSGMKCRVLLNGTEIKN